MTQTGYRRDRPTRKNVEGATTADCGLKVFYRRIIKSDANAPTAGGANKAVGDEPSANK